MAMSMVMVMVMAAVLAMVMVVGSPDDIAFSLGPPSVRTRLALGSLPVTPEVIPPAVPFERTTQRTVLPEEILPEEILPE